MASFASCETGHNNTDGQAKSYFDIKGYFTTEASRLARSSPMVVKTIEDNGNPETRKVKISSWQNELSLFTESDINKASWKDSYNVEKGNLSIKYLAKDPKLRTRMIEVQYLADKRVKSVTINNESHNILYANTEHLEYFPDSLYKIEKIQRVKVLGSHDYRIQVNLK